MPLPLFCLAQSDFMQILCLLFFSVSISGSGGLLCVTVSPRTPGTPLIILPGFKSLKQDFRGGPGVKNPPASAGDAGLVPGPGRFHMLQGNQACVPQLLKPVCLEPSLVASLVVKNPPANAGDMGSIPGPGRVHTPRKQLSHNY